MRTGPETGRGGGPSGLGAIAVVFAAVLIWWWFGGNGPMTPTMNSERLAVPDVDASASGTTSPARAQAREPGTVPIRSYELRAPNRLAVTYTTGTPQCVGSLDTPEVVENDASVTITLHLDLGQRPEGACRQISRVERVPVDLDVPLGDRSVLDGSLPRAQRVPSAEERR